MLGVLSGILHSKAIPSLEIAYLILYLSIRLISSLTNWLKLWQSRANP